MRLNVARSRTKMTFFNFGPPKFLLIDDGHLSRLNVHNNHKRVTMLCYLTLQGYSAYATYQHEIARKKTIILAWKKPPPRDVNEKFVKALFPSCVMANTHRHTHTQASTIVAASYTRLLTNSYSICIIVTAATTPDSILFNTKIK